MADTGTNLLAPFFEVKVKNFFSDSPVLASVSSNSLCEATSLHDGAPTHPSETGEGGRRAARRTCRTCNWSHCSSLLG